MVDFEYVMVSDLRTYIVKRGKGKMGNNSSPGDVTYICSKSFCFMRFKHLDT